MLKSLIINKSINVFYTIMQFLILVKYDRNKLSIFMQLTSVLDEHNTICLLALSVSILKYVLSVTKLSTSPKSRRKVFSFLIRTSFTPNTHTGRLTE